MFRGLAALREQENEKAWPTICGLQYRPFRTFSVYPTTPPRGHVLILFKAYLDDSGDASHSFMSVAGYVSDDWGYFESQWRSVLREAGVPYLHMKEFGNRDSEIYRHIKADKNVEAKFISDLVDVIYESVDACVMTVVSLKELKEFNGAKKLRIDPYAICMYGCLLAMREEYVLLNALQGSEVIVDAITKAPSSSLSD
jgi:hypothetical protein